MRLSEGCGFVSVLPTPSPSCLQDVLDQSLYQCGIAGREVLHKHWQYSVKGYASRLQQTAAELQEEYQRLTVCLCVLSVFVSVCVCVSIDLSVCLSASLLILDFMCIRRCIIQRLTVCLSTRLFVSIHLSECILALTSLTPMYDCSVTLMTDDFLSLQEPPGAKQRCVTVDNGAHSQAVWSFNSIPLLKDWKKVCSEARAY